MKIEIITNDDGEVYTLFDAGGVFSTHSKVCIIKRELGIDRVGIAPRELWEELQQKHEVTVLPQGSGKGTS
mgnify:CR=1 FL=1